LSDCDRYVDGSNKKCVNNANTKPGDSNQEWLQYHVVNNLYGRVMSQMLSTDTCTWFNKQQLNIVGLIN